MARTQLPPPLPPETRTVGQLVAESIRLYGARFWPSLERYQLSQPDFQTIYGIRRWIRSLYRFWTTCRMSRNFAPRRR